MTNVRIDQNGVPKGPVYDPLAPAAHRSSVTAVDSSDPSDTSGALDCDGYQECRFDITLTGTALTSLEVAVLFWNSRQSKWFAGASRVFTAIAYLKVVAFSGTSFSLDADNVLS